MKQDGDERAHQRGATNTFLRERGQSVPNQESHMLQTLGLSPPKQQSVEEKNAPLPTKKGNQQQKYGERQTTRTRGHYSNKGSRQLENKQQGANEALEQWRKERARNNNVEEMKQSTAEENITTQAATAVNHAAPKRRSQADTTIDQRVIG